MFSELNINYFYEKTAYSLQNEYAVFLIKPTLTFNSLSINISLYEKYIW
ncbi:hypothetical protein BN1002_04379 [Bacillus sp. B-jedd]|nr:hypothetical protein BN1002_04379 [Bacillus sp. B-jedd]